MCPLLLMRLKEFVIPLQSAEPKIHILHNKYTKLITDIALRFIDKSYDLRFQR